MGLHMRLAEIEKDLLKLAKTYDYADINFTTEDVGRNRIKLVIIAFAPGDNSVGIPDTQDSFVYKLTTRYADDMPTGYSVELMGQLVSKMYGNRVEPIADEEIRVCALDLGGIAARLLFQNDYYA